VADRVDVIVAGAGPAGCAAAIVARRAGASVTLVEPSARGRPLFGESLPPETGLLLRQLGAWDAFQDLAPARCAGSASAWGSDSLGFNDAFFSPHGMGWHVERRAFDAMLLRVAADAGVTIERGRVAVIGRGRTIVRRRQGGATEVDAAVIIDATGGGARLARAFGAERLVVDRLVCVGRLVPLNDMATLTDMTLLEAVEYGWWYAAKLGPAHALVVIASDLDLIQERRLNEPDGWREHLSRTRHVAGAVGRLAAARGSLTIRAAASARLTTTSTDNWAAIGDAAATFDPLMSQGVFKALADGTLAGRGAAARLGGASDPFGPLDAAVRRRWNEYEHARGSFYASEPRWAAAPFWQRRSGGGPRRQMMMPSIEAEERYP